MASMARSPTINSCSVSLPFLLDSTLFRTICADVFDGVMVTLAMYTLNILNPGHLLQVSSMNTYSGTSSYEMEEGKQRTP